MLCGAPALKTMEIQLFCKLFGKNKKKFLDSRAGDPEGKALIGQALNIQFADIAGAWMRDKIKQESRMLL